MSNPYLAGLAKLDLYAARERERDELERIEEEKEEAYRKERERSAVTLHCAQCQADTKHYPIPGRASYECSECYEQRGGAE